MAWLVEREGHLRSLTDLKRLVALYLAVSVTSKEIWHHDAEVGSQAIFMYRSLARR